MNNKILTTVIASSLMLASCSGSKSGGAGGAAAGAGTVTESATATATPGYVGGTAAVGAPLGLGNVKITCTGGGSKIGKTNSLGVYSIDVSVGCAAPFHVKVSSSNGEVETIAVNSGTIVNVTPLTQLIARRAVGNANLAANLALVTSTKMKDAQDAIKEALKEYAVAINVSASPAAFLDTDLLGGAFAANGAGVDKLLDLIKVETGTGNAFNIKIGVTPIAVDVDSTVAITAPTSGQVSSAATAAATTSTLLEGVRAYTKSLSAAFKDGRPSEAVFNQMMDANLLHQGGDREKLYEDLDGSDVKGLEFRNVVIIDSDPNNFWVAFQIFGIENGSYSLWNTWTSKVDLDGNGGKGTLLGNRLPVGLWPAFIKQSQINGTNQVVPASSSYRALEVGSVGYQNTIEFKEYNGVAITGGSVNLISGLVDPNDSRLVDNLSAEFIVVHPNDAKKSITKVTFAENGGSNQEAYVYIPQVGEENPESYVTMTYPAFKAATDESNNCQYASNAFPTFDGYKLSKEDFDLAGLEIYFMGYPVPNPGSGVAGVDLYPGFAAYSWDQLTEARFNSKLIPYAGSTLEIGKMDIANYTINDVAYHTIYTCK